MFVEIVVADTIRIASADFQRDLTVVLQDEIHSRYVNRVIPYQGLCICLKGIDKVGESKLYAGESCSFVRVTFRLVLFKPFVDEVLVGRIVKSDSHGITVSVEFFENIYIPKEKLQQPSTFDQNEQLWKWEYQGHELFMDKDEKIIVRVTDVEFRVNTKPQGLQGLDPQADVLPPVMMVQGAINEDYFGLENWWEA